MSEEQDENLFKEIQDEVWDIYWSVFREIEDERAKQTKSETVDGQGGNPVPPDSVDE